MGCLFKFRLRFWLKLVSFWERGEVEVKFVLFLLFVNRWLWWNRGGEDWNVG